MDQKNILPLVAGFAGISGAKLEMLFVDARTRARGVGGVLLETALGERGVTLVDVNEANHQAVTFYRRRGFEVVGRSELDDHRRPHPLLHLAHAGGDASDDAVEC